MGKLTDEMKEMITGFMPAYVATADKSGKPNVSPKGSIRVLDDDTLIFADILSPNTRANLEENPQVSIDVVNIKGMKGFQFKGNVELLTSGPIFDGMVEGLKNNPATSKLPPPKYVVKVAVEEVLPQPAR
jgi:predicted pyridoxine 5'-phosphate oxidase superfamily flavin-nucleotide-binding protein